MTSQRNAADRVRPFLQAMERSISAARQRRLNKPAPGSLASASASPEESAADDGRLRLRARPKRPGNLVGGPRFETTPLTAPPR
jgi:hypothetical protein